TTSAIYNLSLHDALPIFGGGGLSSGLGYHIRKYAPYVKLYGVEPEGAPSMQAALANGGPIELEHINKFVDGAAVKKIGALTYNRSEEHTSELQSRENLVC